MKEISLAFSPCPNDTFIFDAMVNGKVDTDDLQYNFSLADVEELNQKAFGQEYDVTKLSYSAFVHLTGAYALLDAGSALGYGTGPLLIARNELPLSEIPMLTVAVPGKNTTAFLLFRLLFGKEAKVKEYLFSDIEAAVLSREVDAGVIIHENRFTYADRGLVQLADLGSFWEKTTQMPVPLGGIAIHHRLGRDIAMKVNRHIQASLNYAWSNYPVLSGFVTCHAQEMSATVMRQHIELYVNGHSQQLGNLGRDAVMTLFKMALGQQLIDHIPENIFALP